MESNDKEKLTVASFFAGVGGIDLGFERAGFKVIWANEFDKHAAKTYALNHRSTLVAKDIREVEAKDIPDFDVMAGGFPCQAFSIDGKQKGFSDTRGTLFFEMERIFLEKSPQVVFLENVKHLVNHDNGQTFKVILEHLEKAGYHVKWKVLNSMDYGNIPQSRERVYIVGFKDKLACERFHFPYHIEVLTILSDLIDYAGDVPPEFYYTEKFRGWEELKARANKVGEVYQWRRGRLTKIKSREGVCMTLQASMGTGGDNAPIILTEGGGIRKLTPKECFNLMGFPQFFRLPPDMAKSHLYKQAGNSVVVPVIERIARQIRIALGHSLSSHEKQGVIPLW